MNILETRLAGVLLLKPQVFGDERGYFYESYNEAKYQAAGIDRRFVQSNISRSARGVLRGLHYQWPNPQGKLVSVLEGEVYDVAVDVRRESPHFGQWVGALLSAENHHHLWIPEGFAHGFCVVSEFATFGYQCTSIYDPSADAGIRWNDGDIAVDWPISEPTLSPKDTRLPFLADIPSAALPVFSS